MLVSFLGFSWFGYPSSTDPIHTRRLLACVFSRAELNSASRASPWVRSRPFPMNCSDSDSSNYSARCHSTECVLANPECHRRSDSSRVSLPFTHAAPISWRPSPRLLNLRFLLSPHVVTSWNRYDQLTRSDQIAGYSGDTEQQDILKVSHGTAVVLLCSESVCP